MIARTLRRAAARARDLLKLRSSPARIASSGALLPESLRSPEAQKALEENEDSEIFTQVRLAQAHRIRARLSISRSHIASARLAHAMTSPTQKPGEGSSSVPSPTASFHQYLPLITSSLDRLTTSANALPASRSDINFHRTMDRRFANDLDDASDRVLRMAERLLTLVETGQKEVEGKGKAKESAKSVKPAAKVATKARRKLEEEEDVVEGYKRGVLSVVDGLLEDAVSHTRERPSGSKANRHRTLASTT